MKTPLEKRLEERERARAEEAAKKPPAPEPAPEPLEDGGPTMRELRTNRRYLAMLETASKTDPSIVEFIARTETNAQTPEDTKSELKWRSEYMKITKELEQFSERLDQNFEKLRRSSKELNELCNAHGPDIFKKALKEGMAERAFRDRAGFSRYANILGDIANRESRITDSKDRLEKAIKDPETVWNKVITDFREKYRVSDDEYKRIQDMDDFAARRNEFQRVMREQMGWMEWFKDRRNEKKRRVSSLDTANAMARSEVEMDTFISSHEKQQKDLAAERDEFIKNAGVLLSTITLDNKDVRDALSRAAAGAESLYPDSVDTMMTMEEARASLKMESLSRSDLRTKFTEYLESRGVDLDVYQSWDDTKKRPIQNTFWKRHVETQLEGKKGLIRRMLEWLLNKKVDDPRVRDALNTV